MKRVCDECGGTGKVICEECDGMGERDFDMATMKPERFGRHQDNYDELIELQKDAQRVIKQAARLKEIRPHRSQSYEEQLHATLSVINGQAEKALAQKKSPKRRPFVF